MRAIFKFLAATALVALVGVMAAAPVEAQQPPANARFLSNSYFAADVSPALYFKFVGTETDPTAATTVQVASGGAITFIKDGAAYTGFECPVSGALGGIIDTSNAACDTLGEIVDSVNSDIYKNFVAVIANGLRSDVVTTSPQLLAAGASTTVKNPLGMPVYWDTSVADDENLALYNASQGILNWVPQGSKKPTPNPFSDTDSVLLYGIEQFTNAGTIGLVDVYCVVENYQSRSETVSVLLEKTGAATTVKGEINELTAIGGFHCQGGKLLVRVEASGADTSAWKFILVGYQAPLSFGR